MTTPRNDTEKPRCGSKDTHNQVPCTQPVIAPRTNCGRHHPTTAAPALTGPRASSAPVVPLVDRAEAIAARLAAATYGPAVNAPGAGAVDLTEEDEILILSAPADLAWSLDRIAELEDHTTELEAKLAQALGDVGTYYDAADALTVRLEKMLRDWNNDSARQAQAALALMGEKEAAEKRAGELEAQMSALLDDGALPREAQCYACSVPLGTTCAETPFGTLCPDCPAGSEPRSA